MEINIEKELQTLKSQYNMFKEGLEKQETLNEKFFKSLRKRPAMAVSKEIRNRMLGDVLTVPMIIVICIGIDWPLLFGILGMNHLLDDDVRTVTEKITGYRRFYTGSLLVGIIPLTAMVTYIFMRLYALADDAATVQLITVSGIVSIVVAIVITLLHYKKHVRRCRELLEQFEEQ